MNKVIRNGKVAVAVSPGFGAGWSTWNQINPMDSRIIEMIESHRQNEISTEWCETHLGVPDQYCGGAVDLVIRWVPVDTRFSITEYDGSESVLLEDDLNWKA